MVRGEKRVLKIPLTVPVPSKKGQNKKGKSATQKTQTIELDIPIIVSKSHDEPNMGNIHRVVKKKIKKKGREEIKYEKPKQIYVLSNSDRPTGVEEIKKIVNFWNNTVSVYDFGDDGYIEIDSTAIRKSCNTKGKTIQLLFITDQSRVGFEMMSGKHYFLYVDEKVDGDFKKRYSGLLTYLMQEKKVLFVRYVTAQYHEKFAIIFPRKTKQTYILMMSHIIPKNLQRGIELDSCPYTECKKGEEKVFEMGLTDTYSKTVVTKRLVDRSQKKIQKVLLKRLQELKETGKVEYSDSESEDEEILGDDDVFQQLVSMF